MTSLVSKYPFDVYGVLAADELFGYALETRPCRCTRASWSTRP